MHRVIGGVSIHAPVMDAIFDELLKVTHIAGFNPRARDGRDYDTSGNVTNVMFQSTRP